MIKRLSTEALGLDRDRFIYVQSVDTERLAPGWPWLIQEIAEGERDATVLYVDGKCFGFAMEQSRAELGVEDWRIRNGAHHDSWQPWILSDELVGAIDAYMRRLGLRFGRLDFIIGDGGPVFLEVNPTGQFGWLDSPSGWPLHGAVLDAILDPSTSISGTETARETGAPMESGSSGFHQE